METRSKNTAVRFEPSLYKRIEKMAERKKWSVSLYIYEAVVEKLAYEEPVKKS